MEIKLSVDLQNKDIRGTFIDDNKVSHKLLIKKRIFSKNTDLVLTKIEFDLDYLDIKNKILDKDPQFSFDLLQKKIEYDKTRKAIPTNISKTNNVDSNKQQQLVFTNNLIFAIPVSVISFFLSKENTNNDQLIRIRQEYEKLNQQERDAQLMNFSIKVLEALNATFYLDFIQDLQLIFNKYFLNVTQDISEELKTEELKDMFFNMQNEIINETGEEGVCPSCVLNRIKNKYLLLSKDIFKKAEKEHEISIQ